jgi:predicted ATPase/DNA-binding transcriptional regulator YiaG
VNQVRKLTDVVAPSTSVNFAHLLRTAREARSLTQNDLARRTGIGVRTLRDLEHGRARPQQATLELLITTLRSVGAEREALLVAAGRGTGVAIHLPPRAVLIGREDETASVVAAIERSPLVTLVGVAGVGKTSIAIEVAYRVVDAFPGGTSAIAISEVSTEADVITAAAAVFDVARAEELPRRLSGRRAFLLVDGVEHAHPAVAAALIRLTSMVPSLHVLATSRHPIELGDELVWPVAPLDVPASDASGLDGYPAVMLFKARLNAVRRAPIPAEDEATVGRLVRRLGGLPLALELAAARGRILEMPEILQRYGDRVLDLGGTPGTDELPTTLRDAVGESYRLLDVAGQRGLRRLASFRHRWSLEMAEPLLADVAPDPVPILERLVDLGLVQIMSTSSMRFRLLDVVREFAVERRRAAGESDEAARTHARIIAAQVLRISPDLVGSGFLSVVRHLDDIASDIRAALDFARVHDPHTALTLAAALPRWWRYRGRDREGREILIGLLNLPEAATADGATAAWAQIGATLLALEHGEGAAELDGTRRALAAFVALNDIGGQLAAHTQLVALYHSDGAYDLARAHGETAFEVATKANRRRDVLVASTNLTWHDIRTGDLAAARTRLAALRVLAGEVGEDRLASLALANLAEVERLDRRYPDAIAIGQRAAAVLEQQGDPRHRRSVQGTVAMAMAECGRVEEAAELLAALRSAAEDGSGAGTFAMIEAYLALYAGDRIRAADRFAAAAGRLAGQQDVRDRVEAMVGYAATIADPGLAAAARAYLAAVCATSAVTLLPKDRALLESA